MKDRRASEIKEGDAPTGLSRRNFLKYVGVGAAVSSAVMGPLSLRAEDQAVTAGHAKVTDPELWISQDGVPNFKPVAYPVPLAGDKAPTNEDATRLAQYVVKDDLVLPEGFEYRIIAKWGDQFGPKTRPEQRIHFGTNCDYTGLIPIEGKKDEYYLHVNHEDVSTRTWLQGFEAVKGKKLAKLGMRFSKEFPKGQLIIDGKELQGSMFTTDQTTQLPPFPANFIEKMRKVCNEGLHDMGISILHVRREASGHFQVIEESPLHRRIYAIGVENQAKDAVFEMTGPAKTQHPKVFGTFSNCSGGTTSWGTFLTCEENIQNHLIQEVDPAGHELAIRPRFLGATSDYEIKGAHPIVQEPHYLNGLFHAMVEKYDAVSYGWICEIDPKTGGMRKHSSLGRFRHENAAIRCEKGEHLAIYMGDDRRGGHVWKFVSEAQVSDPTDPTNTRLLEKGTLYVAQFKSDHKGVWVPLTPKTKLVKPEPEHCSLGHIMLPARPAGGEVAVGDSETAAHAEIPVQLWVSAVERFAKKPFAECTLGDLTRPNLKADDPRFEEDQQGILLADAFVMANAAGGTPSCRPEDLEIHPVDKSVYISFTDATGKREGAPDMRIFPDSSLKNSRQYGGVYRIVEQDSKPNAQTFEWGRFVSSGDVVENGGGFACADNLVFDPAGHLWMVNDISTNVQNFPVSRDPGDETSPGQSNYPGIFGNNAMFCIPTSGPLAGTPHCFAVGPIEAELTGPTFSSDGKTLILAVQHPGELSGTRKKGAKEETRSFKITGRNGKVFEQKRRVPVGSNFPDNQPGAFPRSVVVSIVRKA